MEVHVHFANEVKSEDSVNLQALADILEQDYDLKVKTIQKEADTGAKDGGLIGGLTIALSITSAAISIVGTIISVLSYWKSQHPKYSISFKVGNKSITIDQVDPNKIEEIVSELQNAQSDPEIVIVKG